MPKNNTAFNGKTGFVVETIAMFVALFPFICVVLAAISVAVGSDNLLFGCATYFGLSAVCHIIDEAVARIEHAFKDGRE